uniref:Putative ribonuclease H-like domain-containing protein n=1 Tax=Tanacetum cinerariifolium TaxID=118510 RepID=A0A6L2M2F8_TANCI|nr:putative ribonuclease H-like domain-containing protein [Tanacetum cinerariifolium]
MSPIQTLGTESTHRRIKEEIYVCQPLGFKDPDHPNRVYKVVKALYGLHLALRAWYETLAKYLLDNGFHRGKIDQTVFIKRQNGDILLVQNEDGIFISQDKYVIEVLRKFNLSDVKTASTPVDTEKPLVKDVDGDDIDVHLYRSMIGSLMYLTTSRPDIIDSPFELVAYTDSDYAGASLDRKSTTGGFAMDKYFGFRIRCWIIDTGEVQITATIDGKVKLVSEVSIRRHLKLEDSNCISTLPNTEIFKQLALMSNIAIAIICLATNRTFNFSKIIFEGMMKILDNEAASTGRDVRHGGAATTVSSLDAGQGSGNINKTLSMPHDLPLPRVYKLRSDEGRMQQNELIDLVTKLTDRVLALETDLQQTKKVYSTGFTKLIMKAEAVYTACYVKNKVLVVKPHNKTPYENFHGRTPTLSFMRPFGCLVTILNTKDHLGKFNGKADEGFFIGYSLNSKAFRMFISRTRIVEENLHIRFSEHTLNIVGSRPDWLFNIDTLTRKMNYEPIVAGTQSNGFIDPKSSHNDGLKPSSNDGKKDDKDPRKETEYNELPFDPNMPALEDVGIFNFLNEDEDDAIVVDMNNMDTTIQVSHVPTTRIHKDHPLNQVIGDLHSTTQTRNMTKNLEEHGFMSSMGELTFFLRLQVKQKNDGIFISQDKYVAEILKKFGFIEVKNASTPMETQKPLFKDEYGEEVDVHIYRIFRYLKGHPKLGLWYPKDSLFDLVAYTNSDYARASLDRKSITRDEEGVDCLPNSTIFENLELMGKPKRKNTQVPQPSGSIEHVADKAVYKELDDRLVRAATTVSSLKVEQDNGGGPRSQKAMGDTTAQTRFENVSKLSNDSLLAREITSLKRRVKKLEKKQMSRTHKLKRLYKVGLTAKVDSSEDGQSLGKDASKQVRKITDIDADEDITLVNDQDEAEMFDVNDLYGKEVFVDKEVADKEVSAAGEVNAVSIATTVSTAATITTNEITLAQTLVEIKTTKSKAKIIVLQEPSESITTTTIISSKKSHDKGKAIMIKEPVKPKKKDQIKLDEEADLKLQVELQAEFDEEQRLAIETTQKELKANIALIETWDDV